MEVLKKVYLCTFGCQMNEHDSERVRDLFLKEGYSVVNEVDEADVVLFNTCSVRRHAEERAYGMVGRLKDLKEKRPWMIIGILGCMAEAEKDEIFKKLPHVDFLCGPADLDAVIDIVNRIRQGAGRIMRLGGYKTRRLPKFSKDRYTDKNAYVKIMEGCNNFCSYCIVPYVRGPERSRPLDEILDEIDCLIDNGVKQITLLGQNVNSYGKDLKKGTDFVGLLESVDRLIQRRSQQKKSDIIKVDFITSHPKDAGINLFKAMADLKSISKKLHLPMQSGSNRILKRMDRGYTIERYTKLVGEFRRIVKDAILTTDIIVGFPGEREEDFEKTMEVLKDIRFDAAYIFKYSPRPFTKASLRYKDDVSKEEKERRHRLLLDMQKKISLYRLRFQSATCPQI